MRAPLPAPRRIVIFRGRASWLADIPDWNAQGVPLPFREWVSAREVREHLHRLHPSARVLFEEDAP